MRGKYSPTVSKAYQADQDWWRKYTGEDEHTYSQYDPEGYDSYGYDKDDRDRAGNYEYEYYSDDLEDGTNFKYNHALDTWTFDGQRPVINGHNHKPVQADLHDRFKDIARKSGVSILYDYSTDGHACVLNLTDLAKFAEMIVRECGEVATESAIRWCRHGEMPDYGYERVIKEHFGVE